MIYDSKKMIWGAVIAVGILLFIGQPFYRVAPTEAKQTLQARGYTSVQVTGLSWFSCSEDDFYATGFRAQSPSGQKVAGTVCSGILKGQTIRLE